MPRSPELSHRETDLQIIISESSTQNNTTMENIIKEGIRVQIPSEMDKEGKWGSEEWNKLLGTLEVLEEKVLSFISSLIFLHLFII